MPRLGSVDRLGQGPRFSAAENTLSLAGGARVSFADILLERRLAVHYKGAAVAAGRE